MLSRMVAKEVKGSYVCAVMSKLSTDLYPSSLKSASQREEMVVAEEREGKESDFIVSSST